MLLPDLPTDILLGIADYLNDADLNALVSTARFMIYLIGISIVGIWPSLRGHGYGIGREERQ
jgi:hypothetical protein